MKKSLLLLLLVGVFAFGDVWAQNSPIQGKVVSAENGETIVGASITVLNTSKGTITDFDGKFSIDVQPGATLVVSYVGMKTVEVPAQSDMVVSLEEDTEVLQEVVVTALGISRRALKSLNSFLSRSSSVL